MSIYTKHKPSGIEWLGDIPEHWKVNRLKNITAKSIGGVWGEEPNEDGEDTIVIRVADFDRDKASIIDSEEFTYRAISEHHLLDRKLNKNDILLEKSGGGERQLVGKAVIFDKDFDAVCANFIQKVEIIDRFDKRFVLHILTAIYDGRINFPYVNQTTGIQNLDITAFFNHCVAYPESKEEQTAIANYLDQKTSKLDRLISNKKTQIKKLKEIRQIEINTAVTKGLDPKVKYKPSGIEWLGDIPVHWEVKRLKNVTKIVNGSTPKSNIEEYWDGEITWVTPGDISKLNGFISESEKMITKEGYLSCGTEMVPEGSTILTCRAPIGNAVIAKKDLCTNQGCKSLIPLRVDYRYLYYFVLSSNEEINSLGQGTTFLELSRTNLGNTKLSLPNSIIEQKAIANYLDEKTSKLDQLVSNLENQIERLQEVRKIEIYNAVTGKIKVA